jgi:hypothetical protein
MASQIYTTGQAGDSKLYYQDPAGAYKQIADTNELQSLAKAGTVQVGGERAILPSGALGTLGTTATQQPLTTSTSGTQGAPTAPVSPSTTGSLEVAPGTYSSSKLVNYYNTELERNRPQYEQAQSQLGDINKQLLDLYGGTSLQETYNQQLTGATAGLDSQLSQVTGELKNVDLALAGVEQEVRARLGQGQAPEAYIQAEIARQSTPLINKRNAIANNVNALQQQRQDALQGVQQSMGFAEADRNRQLTLLQAQRELAQETIGTFNALIEKGEMATEKEKDNARQMFSMFLQQSPDFLTSLDEGELAQLQSGTIPYSALSKLGKTINQQKLEASQDKNQLVGSGETGYFLVNPTTGETTQVIAPKTGPNANSVSESDIRQLANTIWDKDPSITSYDQAYRQAQSMLGGGFGDPSRGLSSGLNMGFDTPSTQTGSQIPDFNTWAGQQEQARGMSLNRDLLKPQYDAFVAAMGTPTTQINERVSQFGRRKDDKYQAAVNTLRDDFKGEQVVKDYNIQKSGFQQSQLVDSYNATPQDDISLVFSFMKVLDPGSVVREGEFETAKKYTSTLDSLGVKFDQVMKGTLLSPTQRENIKKSMEKRFGTAASNYQNVADQYANQAKSYKVDPQDFIIDYGANITSTGGLDVGGYLNSFTNDPSKSVNGSTGGTNMSRVPSASTLSRYMPGQSTGAQNTGMQNTGMQNQSRQTVAPSIGKLSSQYESRGNPGAIGYDNTGGLSYGTYQLAHNNAQKFVNESPYANEFKGIPFNSQAFQNKWKEIAKRDPNGFAAAQHKYIEKTHFEPQVSKLQKLGLNIRKLSPILQDVIWSTAVQHGPANDIIAQAVKATKNKADPVEFIKNVYNLRWANGRNFARSTADVKKGVYNRFFGPNGEMEKAIALVTGRA